MRCLLCDGNTRVTNTNKKQDNIIERYRKCVECDTNFVTHEKVTATKGRGYMTNLERLREDNGLTKSKLANYLNISNASYTNKERGETEFNFSEAYKLAKYFKISMEHLYELLTTIVEE